MAMKEYRTSNLRHVDVLRSVPFSVRRLSDLFTGAQSSTSCSVRRPPTEQPVAMVSRLNTAGMRRIKTLLVHAEYSTKLGQNPTSTRMTPETTSSNNNTTTTHRVSNNT